jgi:cysteine desulfurase
MKTIYLDNSATTQPYAEVVDTYAKALQQYYGNPSSLHHVGIEAEKMLAAARQIAADLLQVERDEIFFTSGGTEGNNLALFGVAREYAKRGKHLIVSQVEHSSVLEVFRQLEKEGFEVTYLPVDRHGRISIRDLEQAIREDTILVSIMCVNNEIGTIQPIAEIGTILSKHPKVHFHVDAVQAFGKIPVIPKAWRVDLLTLSGHKFHGPKGTGLLYKSKKTRLHPLMIGGGQEEGVRPGTQNVPGIIAFTKAMRISAENTLKFGKEVGHLRELLWQGIENIPGLFINSPKDGAPHILNFSAPGIKAEVLLHSLEEKGIFVSTKSACSSKEESISHVLEAIKLPKERAKSAIRVSLSRFNTKEEIEYVVLTLRDTIEKLKRITKV